MFERSVLQQFIKRIKEPRRFMQVVMGPRQVGKTTMITQLLKKITIPWLFESADAVPASTAVWLEQLWESARLKMALNRSAEFLLVIDEIQKIDNWSEIVKRLWDEDTRHGKNIKV